MSDQFSDSREYQIKLLSYMLANADFCDIAKDVLKDEHFSDRALQWFFDAFRKSDVHLTPSTLQHELMKGVKNKEIRKDEIDKYLEYYDFVKQRPLPIEEEHINAELGSFIRTQATKKALMESWDLAKNESWDEIVEKMQDAVTQGLDVLDLGTFFFKSYQDRLSARVNETVAPKISTGIPDLDDLMYGGIKPKQLGLIAGGTGRGKSIFLAWLARVAVLLGHRVVYYTFELSEQDISERFDALFSAVKINELKLYNNKVFSALSPLASKYGDKLVVKEYPPDEATVGTLKAHLRQLSGVGFVPDLVIVDYLDLIKPHRNYNSQHEELDAITKALRGVAVQFDTRIWTATQLNRSGMAMETPDETAVAGAVAKLFTADVSIFMAQTVEEREDQIMRLMLAKNRNGPAGLTIKLDTDYSRMAFYRPPAALPGPPASQPAVQSAALTPTPQQSECDPDNNDEQKPDGASEEDDVFLLQ